MKSCLLFHRDLGVHIDGFIATAAHTLQVPQAEQQAGPVTGRAADVIAAAQTALEAALRLIRPGKRISDVPEILKKIVEAYGCNLVEGVMSHQMKQFVIDANKCVLNRPSPEHKVEDGEFEENEVYAVDIVVSTGEGKPKVCLLCNLLLGCIVTYTLFNFAMIFAITCVTWHVHTSLCAIPALSTPSDCMSVACTTQASREGSCQRLDCHQPFGVPQIQALLPAHLSGSSAVVDTAAPHHSASLVYSARK